MATEPRGVTLESPTVWVKMLSPSMAYSVVPLISPVIACLSERADVVHGTVDVDAMKLVPVEWVTREFRDVKVDAGGVQSDEAVGREAQRVDEEGGLPAGPVVKRLARASCVTPWKLEPAVVPP